MDLYQGKDYDNTSIEDIPPPLGFLVPSRPRPAQHRFVQFVRANTSLETPESMQDAAIKEGALASDASALLGPNVSRLMASVGYKGTGGLGRNEVGSQAPLEVFEKVGRGGLGFHKGPTNFAPQKHTVNVEKEIPVKQTPQWYSSENEDVKVHLAQEDPLCEKVCSLPLEKEQMEAKTVFDGKSDGAFLAARKKANPYEMIGKCIFINRAACKMANLDRVFQLIPSAYSMDNAPTPQAKYTFVDVASGPGGFSEYVLWRTRKCSWGIGMTLKGDHDFTQRRFHTDLQPLGKSFRALYGPDGDGNLYSEANLRVLSDVVEKDTKGWGVDLVMGDGGFSVKGDENFQEVLLKQLVTCQFLAGLMCLRRGGHFVCKIFDVRTEYSVGLVYLMATLFERVCLYKPFTSRPANSERYIVCQSLRERSPKKAIDALIRANAMFNTKMDTMDLLEIVPLNTMEPAFLSYVRERNIEMCRRQIGGLVMIRRYMEDKGLALVDQEQIRERCLSYWRLPLSTSDPAWSIRNKIQRAPVQFVNLGEQNVDSWEVTPHKTVAEVEAEARKKHKRRLERVQVIKKANKKVLPPVVEPTAPIIQVEEEEEDISDLLSAYDGSRVETIPSSRLVPLRSVPVASPQREDPVHRVLSQGQKQKEPVKLQLKKLRAVVRKEHGLVPSSRTSRRKRLAVRPKASVEKPVVNDKLMEALKRAQRPPQGW